MGHTERVAIVTGASRGIGRPIASRLAESGFAVTVDYAGSTADAEDAASTMTRRALWKASRAFSPRSWARDITVNAVAPGLVETELSLNGKSETEVKRMAGMAPFGRVGGLREIADAMGFLVSPEAGWVNGQVVRANGGIG